MSEDALEYVARQWATRIRDRPLPDGLEGVYDAERNEIILSDKLSPIQRRCVLAHEISHAKHHDIGCKTDIYTEQRADIEAARMLMSQADYVTAELLYGSNECAIARELNVMPWIIRAYKNWLHDSVAI